MVPLQGLTCPAARCLGFWTSTSAIGYWPSNWGGWTPRHFVTRRRQLPKHHPPLQRLQVWAASAAAVQHMQQLGVVGRTGLAREILPAASSHLQVLILQCLPGLWPRASHFPSPSPCCFLSLEHPSPRSLPGCSSFLCLLKYHLLQEVFPGHPS